MLPIVRWMDPREFPASDITLQCDFSTPTVGSPACFILSRNTVPVYSHAHRISLLCIKFSKDFCLRFQFFTLFYYLFIYIWLCQVFFAAEGLSIVVVSRSWGMVTLCCGARASHCGGASRCRIQALGCLGFSSCGAWAQLPHSMWNLPRPWIESLSPTLAGGS